MSIASELQNYEDGLGDAYDAAQTMGAVMPAQKNMNNLDATILTIPQPTVNDGTLTIQQNGTTLGTFTANQASNTTVNITGGGGSSVTVFYGYIVEGENKHFYSDQAMTTAITAQDFQDAIDDTTQVVVIYDVDGDEQHVVVIGEGGTARVIGALGDAVYKIQGDSTPSSTNFTITATNLQHRLTAGSNISISGDTISATDTTYTHFTGATSSADGTQGLVPGPLAGDQEKVLHGDGTWKDTTAKLVEMSYGESNAWAKFIAAYNAGSIVYCRASSNANPGTGSQTRKAFMAYVNNATNPTNVEFQYVRSQSSKTDSQQCDQVFVYTLTNASGGTWSVASRNVAPKINVSGPITKTFTSGANATITIGADAMTGATSSTAGAAGVVPAPAAGDEDKVLSGAGTWVNQPAMPTVNDGTLTIQHNGTSVQTFTANQSTSATANIQTIYSVDAIDTTAVTPTVTADMIDWSTMRATLWTNPDPTTSYAGTSFTVAGLSNWDYIAVVARTHTSQNQMNIFKVEYANGGIEISFADNGNTMDRNITWSGNTVTVSGGRLNANTANDRCVPVKIIGMMY